MDALTAIASRRSTGRLGAPAPEGDDLHAILFAGASAPDHGGLRPFRFILLRGEGLVAFGDVLADAYMARCQAAGTEPVPAKLEKERTKLARAPLVVVVVAVRQPSTKIPWLEQQQAVAAACQNILLAATALGFGSMWRTDDPVYDERVKAALGVGPDDAVAGFVHLGTGPDDPSSNPQRDPDLTGLVREWAP